MSNRTLVYSPLSRCDLDEIFDYISCELENPAAAHETVNAILDGAESLEGFPFVGSLVEGIPFLKEGYRFLPVRNYLIFYRITDTQVFVDRILYKKRDYSQLLGL